MFKKGDLVVEESNYGPGLKKYFGIVVDENTSYGKIKTNSGDLCLSRTRLITDDDKNDSEVLDELDSYYENFRYTLHSLKRELDRRQKDYNDWVSLYEAEQKQYGEYGFTVPDYIPQNN